MSDEHTDELEWFARGWLSERATVKDYKLADEISHRVTEYPTLLATLETIAVLDPEEQDMRELQKWVRGVLAKVKGEEVS